MRLFAEWADMFPLVSRFPPHLFSPRLAAVAVAAAAAVAECTRPRRETKNPSSATHGEGAHDFTPIAGLQLLLYSSASAGIPPSLRAATTFTIGEFLRWWYSSPPVAPAVGGD